MTNFAFVLALALGAADAPEAVAFCEMVAAPAQFLDRPVVVEARFEQATEGSYLSHPQCPLPRDDRIGVGAIELVEGDRAQRVDAMRRLSAIEYGGRADVRVVGVLRDAPLRGFASYRYRFDVARFERIAHVVLTYEGVLQLGQTYRAQVRRHGRAELALVEPLRIPAHHGLRLEWTNRTAFAVPLRPSAPDWATFSVVGDVIRQVDERRWNRTVTLKILSVE